MAGKIMVGDIFNIAYNAFSLCMGYLQMTVDSFNKIINDKEVRQCHYPKLKKKQ